jgi:5-formyltetrahydrofolate cyclo-ligase
MSSQGAPSGKTEIRRQLRRARNAVPVGLRLAAARHAMRLALHHRLLARTRRAGFYIPAKGEFDCLPLIDRALHMGMACYLPMVPPTRQKKLWFSKLGDGPHWALNRYGIPEYVRHSGRIRVTGLDILFMPMLGFDRQGYRMGMGGGYYDSSLAYLAKRRHWRRPLLIGLAFEIQGLEQLPSDPWDIPLDGVITERQYHRFKRG